MANRASFQRLADNLINKTFSDFRDDIILTEVGDFDYDTQANAVISTLETKGIRLEYSKYQFDGSNIEQGDYKIVLPQQSVPFEVRVDNVKMKFNGKDVEIINVSSDAARAAYTLQVRDL